MAALTTKALVVDLVKNKYSSAETPVALAALDSTDDATIYTASTGTYGILIPYGNTDSEMVIKVQNTDTSNVEAVYIVPGDSDFKAIDNLSISLAAGSTYFIALDSAKYLFTKGAYKGNVVLVGASADVKVTVINIK